MIFERFRARNRTRRPVALGLQEAIPADQEASIGSAVNHLWDLAYGSGQPRQRATRRCGCRAAQRGLTLSCDPDPNLCATSMGGAVSSVPGWESFWRLPRVNEPVTNEIAGPELLLRQNPRPCS